MSNDLWWLDYLLVWGGLWKINIAILEIPTFWEWQPPYFPPLLHERFTFQMPAGTQELRGGGWGGVGWSEERERVGGGWFDQAAGGYTLPPTHPLLHPRSLPPHLSSTERGNKSDRVQSLSLICQWGEWVGMRLSDRPAVACQPYWIMTWQEAARYEPHTAVARYGGAKIQAWGSGVEKGGWNETCLYVKFMMSFTG